MFLKLKLIGRPIKPVSLLKVVFLLDILDHFCKTYMYLDIKSSVRMVYRWY
jgi:hypothetical protein